MILQLEAEGSHSLEINKPRPPSGPHPNQDNFNEPRYTTSFVRETNNQKQAWTGPFPDVVACKHGANGVAGYIADRTTAET